MAKPEALPGMEPHLIVLEPPDCSMVAWIEDGAVSMILSWGGVTRNDYRPYLPEYRT